MSGLNDGFNETCRTCLSYFDEKNGKCSLMNSSAITSDSGRLQIMRNLLTSCSLTLLTSPEEQEVFLCTPCVLEIDRILSFLQKCMRSEAVLRQGVKRESPWVDDHGDAIQPKVEGSEVSKEETEEQGHRAFSSTLPLAFQKYRRVRCKTHKCIICHKSFRTLPLIRRHMAAEHENSYEPFFCKQCPEVFTSKYNLTKHERRVHNAKVYSCSTCKKTFSTVASLKFHENIHLGKRPQSVATASNLAKPERKQHACHCGRKFDRKKKLEFHVETVHEKKAKVGRHPCPECDKKFHHPYSLKNHLNTHLGVKPFLCNACGAAFAALSYLTGHLRRVHSEQKRPSAKKYLCHTCGDSFARASHLKRHNLRKHVPDAEKKHECPVCKKRFLEKSDVTGHVKLHDDLKPFVCDQCTKCFRTGWRLQAHVNRVHLGLRPFQCPTCSLKFKAKSHLEKHIRTHTGEKPFPCPHCTYACAEKSNLKKHLNIHLKAT